MVTSPDLTITGRHLLRGELARHYLFGSLTYSARRPDDLPALLERAFDWHRRLAELGLTLPFHVVLDLGYLLLEGQDFPFRSLLGDAAPPADPWHELYENRLLVRRLQETRFPLLRRTILDNPAPDAAVCRALELLLAPVARQLPWRLTVEGVPTFGGFDPADCPRHLAEFEAGLGQPGLLGEIQRALVAAAGEIDLTQVLHDEDVWELAHIDVFPRDSLREAARRIKSVERHLGARSQAEVRALRERALAATTLDSLGTYPSGGIAELTCVGPLENLVPSELVHLDRSAPIDSFLVRFAEDQLLKYLRDNAVLRMMRRSVVFLIEDCPEFGFPLTSAGPLGGTKISRCLMGLTLRLADDLLAIFRRDDLTLRLHLLAPPDASPDALAERQEIADILHLLFREKEEQGAVAVHLSSRSPADELADLSPEPARERRLVILGRPASLAPLIGETTGVERRMLLPVEVGGTPAGSGPAPLAFGDDPLAALRRARRQILNWLVGG